MPPDDQWAPPLPAAVRRASEEADRLAREAGLANAPPAPDAPVVDNPGDTPPADESPTVGTMAESAAPEAASPPVDESPPPAPPAPRDPDWEQRYATLQGKYNAELPELRGQIRSLQDLIGSMQRAEARSTEVRRSAPVVSQEDVDAYGQDLVTASQRWAEAQLAPRFAEYERRLSEVESGSQQLARHTAGQAVESQLDRNIPDWRQINVDPAFILWLDQTDPFTGQKRQQLLNDAYSAGDGPRTIAFFTAYQREQTAVTPPAGLGTRPRQTNGAMAPPAERPSLAELAVPGRGQQAAPAASGAQDSRRKWTNAEIAAFYRQKTAGRWAGREADAEAIEREIFQAAAEGRVNP